MVINVYDAGTFPLVMGQVMISYLCLSPLQSGFKWRFLSFIILANLICMLAAHITFMFQHIRDFAVMGSTCTTVSASVQTVTKIILMNYYKKDLAYIWNTISNEFWPANITDKSTERSIRLSSYIITVMVCIYLTSAFCSAWDYMAIHLVFGRKILPAESSFPFQWDISPRFELLTVWQFIIFMYIIIHVIATHDFFFNALVTSCIAQFKLLQTTLLSIGTGTDIIINRRLNKFSASNNGYPRHNYKVSEQYDLVAKCVEHHNKVIDICERIQHVYGGIILLQFFISALALCVSTFVLTHFDGYLTKMLSFATAHLIQFFFLCAIANDLISQSTNIAEAAYCSSWYNCREERVHHALSLIIQRAQREVKMSALGFANLDYPNFVNVLRFSFSFYTLLSSLEEE